MVILVIILKYPHIHITSSLCTLQTAVFKKEKTSKFVTYFFHSLPKQMYALARSTSLWLEVAVLMWNTVFTLGKTLLHLSTGDTQISKWKFLVVALNNRERHVWPANKNWTYRKHTPEKHNYHVKQFLKHPFMCQLLKKPKWYSYYLLQQSINSRHVLDKLLEDTSHCLLFANFPY